MMRAPTVVVFSLFLVAVLPEVGWACPVCFDPNDESRGAFLATTAFLSLLPLGMIGGVGIWFRKRLRGGGEEAEDSPQGDAGDD